jgi:hypothetical protein
MISAKVEMITVNNFLPDNPIPNLSIVIENVNSSASKFSSNLYMENYSKSFAQSQNKKQNHHKGL